MNVRSLLMTKRSLNRLLKASTFKGLGGDPAPFVVVLDGGSEFQVTAVREHIDLTIGPFDASETGPVQ